MRDVADRIKGRVQLTTDRHRAYLNAVEDTFGIDVDYAQLQKNYGASNEPERRYSPAQCIGCDIKVVSGRRDPEHVSTSFVGRQNLTMRMSMRDSLASPMPSLRKWRIMRLRSPYISSITTSPESTKRSVSPRRWPLVSLSMFGAMRKSRPLPSREGRGIGFERSGRLVRRRELIRADRGLLFV